jgi:hypothetical protein
MTSFEISKFESVLTDTHLSSLLESKDLVLLSPMALKAEWYTSHPLNWADDLNSSQLISAATRMIKRLNEEVKCCLLLAQTDKPKRARLLSAFSEVTANSSRWWHHSILKLLAFDRAIWGVSSNNYQVGVPHSPHGIFPRIHPGSERYIIQPDTFKQRISALLPILAVDALDSIPNNISVSTSLFRYISIGNHAINLARITTNLSLAALGLRGLILVYHSNMK